MNAHHVRISLLGDLEVVRADGTTVSPEEWKTGKTRDLLRLLALSNGQAVRTSGLIDKLWPDARPDRAASSLRTAASRIRSAVRANCIVREPWGLVLRGAWVDLAEFTEAAHRAQAAAEHGRHADVLAEALRAEQLHRGDFHAHDDDSDWARAARDEVAYLRRDVLCDAAAAALELGHHREALQLATTAVGLDRTSEAAHRSLMRAHAELGDFGSALRVFETYRSLLAEEFGADPSPQTRELHLWLLRGGAARAGTGT